MHNWHLSLLLIFSFGSSFSPLARATIVASDDREVVNFEDLRFTPFVKVQSALGTCGGSFVGPNIVATAAHCVPYAKGPEKKLRSSPTIQTKSTAHGFSKSANVVDAIFPPMIFADNQWSFDPLNDWILLIVGSPLGNEMGYYSLGDVDVKGIFYLLGYGFDYDGNPTLSPACGIQAVTSNTLETDCDMLQGNSGGPAIVCTGMKRSSCSLIGIASSVLSPVALPKIPGLNVVVQVRSYAPDIAGVLTRVDLFRSPLKNYLSRLSP
jgi:hypothetical protein